MWLPADIGFSKTNLLEWVVQLACCSSLSVCLCVAFLSCLFSSIHRIVLVKAFELVWCNITLFLFLQGRVHLMGLSQVGGIPGTLVIATWDHGILKHGLWLGYLRGAQILQCWGLHPRISELHLMLIMPSRLQLCSSLKLVAQPVDSYWICGLEISWQSSGWTSVCRL